MSQVIQLSQSQFENLVERLNRLEKIVAKLLDKKRNHLMELRSGGNGQIEKLSKT
jgi:uncharacterized protein (UPF0335 family)